MVVFGVHRRLLPLRIDRVGFLVLGAPNGLFVMEVLRIIFSVNRFLLSDFIVNFVLL